ncbi:alpha/beta hydrolase family protein [Celeribacter indicus]|uniref:Uncharacterized protein n=1 Tax=Celeribacter indicus TaxID=1208324 RepID=A0A0B5DTI3_9RHOB|nr:alpha/beta fold hydrolase [Celeribacter indicus]AJE46738.1 hypothetical protein P73_2023 [Celeribacter indicus]SDX05261.1 2,6-dihydroxypseudooxynicotine hydrolase [Celeribacter indicus]
MPTTDAARFHTVLPVAFQTMRLVSEGLDVFEAFRVLDRITDAGDWHDRMAAAGDDWAQRGADAETHGHTLSAERAFRQSAGFYLGAALWNVPDPALTTPTYMKCVAAFRRAAALTTHPAMTPVTIPFEGVDLPGYLYRPEGLSDGEKVPAVIVIGGTDATKEEADGLGARELALRGVAVLTFDGPGQGEPLRLHNLVSRPDYETVLSRAIDVLETVDFVDTGRIGLLGASLGTYYATRGATDPRVKALVCHGSIFDMVSESTRMQTRPDHANFRLITGKTSAEDIRAYFAAYNLAEIAPTVNCPVLVVHSGQDNIVAADSGHRLRDAFGDNAELVFLEDGLHCCIEYYARLQPRMYDWLIDRLKAA